MFGTPADGSIYFRARGGQKYGWGHAVRTMTLAGAATRRWPATRLAIGLEGDGALRDRFGEASALFLSEASETDAKRADREQDFLDRFAPDAIVLDAIDPSAALLARCRRSTRTFAAFSDLGEARAGADLLICPQILPVPPDSGAAALLYGPEYFVYREEIDALHARPLQVPLRARRLLVLLGGALTTPVFESTAAIVEALPTDLAVDFVTGFDSETSDDAIRERLGARADIHRGTHSLGALIEAADIALAAGGYVKYELAAAGLPTVLVAIVDHQEVLARAFSERSGGAIYAGVLSQTAAKDVAGTIAALAGDRERRRRLAEAGRAFCPGGGVERILDAIGEARARDLAGCAGSRA